MNEPNWEGRIAETEIEVRSYELDSFGHVNHAVFLNYLEHARFNVLRAGGVPPESLPERGWGVYVVRLYIDYLKEARVGDRLLIRTHLAELRRTSMVLSQEVLLAEHPDVRVAEARVTAVWVGADRRPMRLPEEVRRAFLG